jgi:gas vesicle protein
MALKSVFRTFVMGAAAGAAAVWFNDPQRGEERREQFTQKAQSAMGTVSKITDDAKEMSGASSGSGSSGSNSSSQSDKSTSGETVDPGMPLGTSVGGTSVGGTSVGGTDPLYAPGDRPI